MPVFSCMAEKTQTVTSQEKLVSCSLEAGWPRFSCQCARILVRGHYLACSWLPPHDVSAERGEETKKEENEERRRRGEKDRKGEGKSERGESLIILELNL